MGEVHVDHYGRAVPKPAHGSANLRVATSSATHILEAMTQLFDRLVDSRLLIRRINVTACRVVPEEQLTTEHRCPKQMELFADYATAECEQTVMQSALDQEHRRQEAVIAIRKRLGRNAVLKGMNLEKGATGRERNAQIGGHKA